MSQISLIYFADVEARYFDVVISHLHFALGIVEY